MLSKLLLLPVCLFLMLNSYSASIILQTKDATVWLPKQTISGNISGFISKKLKWHLNNTSGFIHVHTNGTFSFVVTLSSKKNVMWVEDAKHPNVTSDTIHYIFGYNPLPEVMPFATIKNNKAVLNLKVLNNPYNLPLHFFLAGFKISFARYNTKPI